MNKVKPFYYTLEMSTPNASTEYVGYLTTDADSHFTVRDVTGAVLVPISGVWTIRTLSFALAFVRFRRMNSGRRYEDQQVPVINNLSQIGRDGCFGLPQPFTLNPRETLEVRFSRTVFVNDANAKTWITFVGERIFA